MKKHTYNSLTAFYNDIRNVAKNPRFDSEKNYDRPRFRGLSLDEINKSRFSYPTGVEKINEFADFTVEKAEWQKYFNSFDGYDIDIDRMMDGLDFLAERRKQKKLPKTMDVYVNITENADVSYNQMLKKTYTAIKVVDHLETLGVRTALFACISVMPKVGKRQYIENVYIEICVKDYPDTVNMGAICTAISPWMLRYHFFQWLIGRYINIADGLGHALHIPKEEIRPNSIVIDEGHCLSLSEANSFISSIKVETAA